MQQIFGLRKLNATNLKQPIVVTIGTFDGVHQAHRLIIKRAVSLARKIQGTSVVCTFYPHPKKVTNPQGIPALLTSLEHRLKLIQLMNPDVCLVLKFGKRFAEIPAEEFVRKILKSKLKTSHLIVGEKFCFGKNKFGDVKWLKLFEKKYKYKLEIIPSLKVGKQIVSSSLIRKLVANGQLEQASRLLGREFSILGRVEKGDCRGHLLGYPTANINPYQEVVPPTGVYAVRVKIKGKIHKAMLNIGLRPTFYKRQRRCLLEIHILNFKKYIYNEQIEIFFVKKIREEKKFKNHNQLIAQLDIDQLNARSILK